MRSWDGCWLLQGPSASEQPSGRNEARNTTLAGCHGLDVRRRGRLLDGRLCTLGRRSCACEGRARRGAVCLFRSHRPWNRAATRIIRWCCGSPQTCNTTPQKVTAVMSYTLPYRRRPLSACRQQASAPCSLPPPLLLHPWRPRPQCLSLSARTRLAVKTPPTAPSTCSFHGRPVGIIEQVALSAAGNLAAQRGLGTVGLLCLGRVPTVGRVTCLRPSPWSCDAGITRFRFAMLAPSPVQARKAEIAAVRRRSRSRRLLP